MIARDAARATLAAGTARVSLVRFAPGRERPWSTEEGVTEFARRRTRTTVEQDVPVELVERVLERWPWLAGDDDEGRPAGPSEMLYAGTAACFIAGGVTSRTGGDVDAARRCHTDPTWILEVLEHAGREERLDDDALRFCTDLAETGSAIAIPPHRGRRPPLVAGEARLDAEGRVRRATWRTVERRRRGRASGPVGWSTTELWDFGIPVEIDRPTVSRDPPLPVALVALAWALRRRRRAYERRA